MLRLKRQIIARKEIEPESLASSHQNRKLLQAWNNGFTHFSKIISFLPVLSASVCDQPIPPERMAPSIQPRKRIRRQCESFWCPRVSLVGNLHSHSSRFVAHLKFLVFIKTTLDLYTLNNLRFYNFQQFSSRVDKVESSNSLKLFSFHQNNS